MYISVNSKKYVVTSNKFYNVKIDKGGKRTKRLSLLDYMSSLEHMHRGLYVDSDSLNSRIDYIPIENPYDYVIYDISEGNVIEKMYITKNGGFDFLVNNLSEEGTSDYLNAELLTNTKGVEGYKILGMMALSKKYLAPYHLAWDKNTKQLQLLKGNNPIGVDDVHLKAIYTLFKLFTTKQERGDHKSVYLINLNNFNKDTFKVMVSMLKLYEIEGDYFYFYNVSLDLEKELVALELPNLYI